MYDIKQLEDEWKRYRKKKLKPWYIGSLVFITLSAFVIIFLTNKKIDFSGFKTYFETSKEILPHENKEKFKDTLAPNEKKVKDIVLVDDALNKLEVKDNVIDISDKIVKESLNILVDIPILEDTEKTLVEEMPETRKKIYLERISLFLQLYLL